MTLFSMWDKTFSQRLINNPLFLLMSPRVLIESLQVKLDCRNCLCCITLGTAKRRRILVKGYFPQQEACYHAV